MKENNTLDKLLKSNKIKINSNQVLNIEIAFLDPNGNLREIIIPKSKIDDALKYGLKCDGSSIGACKVTDSDLKINLDKNSVYLFPNNNLFVLSNTNHRFDSRKNLKKYEKEKMKDNLQINIGVELEFFLFCKDKTTDKLGYYEIGNGKEFECLNEAISFCEKIGFEIENFHHECGHGQFEINFKYNLPHKTADNIIYLKRLIEIFANKYDLLASFSPKPIIAECGSGMHTNISIFQNNKNLFYNKKDALKLSNFAYSFADGIISHIGALTVFSNPTPESFIRLKEGLETPKNICMYGKNRTALIRVPISSERSTRIEFRLPDASSNPYLLFNAILLAGFDNSYKQKINNLPENINQSKKYLLNDMLLNKLVPKQFFD